MKFQVVMSEEEYTNLCDVVFRPETGIVFISSDFSDDEKSDVLSDLVKYSKNYEAWGQGIFITESEYGIIFFSTEKLPEDFVEVLCDFILASETVTDSNNYVLDKCSYDKLAGNLPHVPCKI